MLAKVKNDIRLIDSRVPYAGYRDMIHRGEVKLDKYSDHVQIGFHKIPLSIYEKWIHQGIITIMEDKTQESEEIMSNLPAVKQENVELVLTPQEQINKASDMARLLKEVVNKAGLAKRLGGKKEHLEFEAWQTIARWHQCTPSTEWTRPIKEGEKIVGWEARVNVLDADGKVIGSSEGMCMADEPNWKGKPSYALRSMAQTRTAGKALRSLFAHIAVLAGYSPTPAEEMDGVVLDEDRRPKVQQPAPTPTPPPKKTEAHPKQEPSDDVPESWMQDRPEGNQVVFIPDKVSKKSGTRNEKEWTRYGILSGDTRYNTFNTEFGDLAESAVEYRFQIRVWYKESKFGRDVEMLEQVMRQPGEEG